MSMKAVFFTPAAVRQWLKLSPDIRKRIDTKLTVYATNGSGDVKRLKGSAGCWLRIGHWRVTFIEDARSSMVVAVGNAGIFTIERKASWTSDSKRPTRAKSPSFLARTTKYLPPRHRKPTKISAL